MSAYPHEAKTPEHSPGATALSRSPICVQRVSMGRLADMGERALYPRACAGADQALYTSLLESAADGVAGRYAQLEALVVAACGNDAETVTGG
jgi:hypothetical protein